jgi:hypothetical protein
MNLRKIINSEIATFKTFLDALWRYLIKLVILIVIVFILTSIGKITMHQLNWNLNEIQNTLFLLTVIIISFLMQGFIVTKIKFLNKYPTKNSFEKFFQNKKP